MAERRNLEVLPDFPEVLERRVEVTSDSEEPRFMARRARWGGLEGWGVYEPPDSV